MAKLSELQELIGAKFADNLEVSCKKCGEPESACVCKDNLELKARDSYFLGINEEKSSGKDITRCGIFYEDLKIMQELLKQAKKKCASGGSLEKINGGICIVLQGKHKEKLKDFFKENKFKFKR